MSKGNLDYFSVVTSAIMNSSGLENFMTDFTLLWIFPQFFKLCDFQTNFCFPWKFNKLGFCGI